MTAIPKKVREEQDEARLEFARNSACVVADWGKSKAADEHRSLCPCQYVHVIKWQLRQRSDAHHVRKGTFAGIARKPPATRTVPLCRALHEEYHRIGYTAFCEKYDIDLEAQLRRINAEYEAVHPKPRVKKERKRPMRVTIHVLHCSACGNSHEVPWRKARGGQFRCINTNQIIEVA